MATFKQWLARARITDDPEGDLVSDLRREQRIGKLPDSALVSPRAMQGYIRLRGGCDGAIEAVPGVWRRFRNWRAP
jgi:hypothetical protein